MKESTLATKIMIAVLCIGVLAFMGAKLFTGFQDDLATTVAYTYSVDIGAEASGIIVREEVVLSDSGNYVDMVLSEGEKASKGESVALIYSDPSVLDTRQAIRTLTAEIEQLNYALSSGTQNTDTTKLDDLVIASIVNLRSLTAGGDLSDLEDSALNLRTMVFRRDYSYGDTDAAADLAQLIRDKESQLATLRKSLNQVSRTVHAPASGVFSGSVDGYETLISPADLDTLTMDGLDELLHRRQTAQTGAAGKLITSSTWYLAALFEGENVHNLSEGSTYTVSFSHDYYGDVEMKLERIETDGQRTMAIFSCRTHLRDTTLLRVQSIDIVTRRLEGIRVPRKALRVETYETTLDDGTKEGTTVTRNRYGVYTLVGTQAELQEVEVLYTGDTFYLVRPVDEDASVRLRAGDTVILSSSGIFDGKVVR